jgi:hypothetical protein
MPKLRAGTIRAQAVVTDLNKVIEFLDSINDQHVKKI